MPHLQGRVFSRYKQYQSLPEDFKAEVNALERYLTTIQKEVFENHTTGLLKSNRGVRYKLLANKIDEFLGNKTNQGTDPTTERESIYDNDPSLPSTGEAKGAAETAPVPVVAKESSTASKSSGTEPTLKEKAIQAKDELVTKAKAMANAAQSKPPAKENCDDVEPPADAPASGAAVHDGSTEKPSTKEKVIEAKEELTHKANAVIEAARGELKREDPLLVPPARKFVVALVLKGFITPFKEDNKFSNAPEVFLFKDNDLFVPVASVITGLTVPVTTVWDLADGAIFAGLLKRKGGLLSSITQGKDVYVIVNARGRNLSLFDSDFGREPILQVDAVIDGTRVAYDDSHFAHGVKVWNETASEIFNAASVSEREAFVDALVAVGMRSTADVQPKVTTAEPETQKVATDTTGITDKVQNLNLDLPLHVPAEQHAEQQRNVEPTRIHNAENAVAGHPGLHASRDKEVDAVTKSEPISTHSTKLPGDDAIGDKSTKVEAAGNQPQNAHVP